MEKRRPGAYAARRGISEIEGEEVKQYELSKPIKQYEKLPGQMSLYFTYESPDAIRDELEQAIMKCPEEEEFKMNTDEESYKTTIAHGKKNCEMSFKISRVGEDDYFCIEFTRKSGTYIDFLGLQKKVENWIEGNESLEEEEDLLAE